MRHGDRPAAFFQQLFSSCRVLNAAAAAVLSQQLAAGSAPLVQPDRPISSAGDAAAAEAAAEPKPVAQSGTAPRAREGRRQQEAAHAAAANEQLVALGLSFEPEVEGSTEFEQQESLEPQQDGLPDGYGVPDAEAPDFGAASDAPASDVASAAASVIDVQPQPSSSTSGSSLYGNAGSSSSSGGQPPHNDSHTVNGSGQHAAEAAPRAVASILPPGASCRPCTAYTHQGIIGPPSQCQPCTSPPSLSCMSAASTS